MADQEPVWDGDGIDPWLGAKLQWALDIAKAERRIYAALAAILRAWLAEAGRRVNAGRVLSPDAIRALRPRWDAEIDRLIDDTVVPVMRQQHRTTTGDDTDTLAISGAVATYLAQLRAQLSDLPDSVYARVVAAIASGVERGDDPEQIRAAVDEATGFDDDGAPYWANWAVSNARTATPSALNVAKYAGFLLLLARGVNPRKKWVAVRDNRTRPDHAAAQGQEAPLLAPFVVGGYAMQYPGDPSAPPALTRNCRCTLLLLV